MTFITGSKGRCPLNAQISILSSLLNNEKTQNTWSEKDFEFITENMGQGPLDFEEVVNEWIMHIFSIYSELIH